MKTRTTRSDTRLRAAGTVGHFGNILVAGVWGFMTMPTASAQTAPSSAAAADIQLPAPPPANTEAGTAEVERVIVTGSNIPTAEETGPNPVDTYRSEDIQKLGIRNSQDLQTFLPQEAGGTKNLNARTGGDGTVQFNLRGILPKETLILIDGKRVAYGGIGL